MICLSCCIISAMAYSKNYFALQLAFAQKVAKLGKLPLVSTVLNYTSFYKTFRINDGDFDPNNDTWRKFTALFTKTSNKLATTYSFYRNRLVLVSPEKEKGSFGCFSYEYLFKEHAILIHFRNNDDSEPGALSKSREPVRSGELKAMFQEIKLKYPQAKLVFGFSWLYNVQAYTRLFPPEYLVHIKKNAEWFKSTALWGQFLDSAGEVKEDSATEFLARMAKCKTLDELKQSFPLKVLEPWARIPYFYQFYKID